MYHYMAKCGELVMLTVVAVARAGVVEHSMGEIEEELLDEVKLDEDEEMELDEDEEDLEEVDL